MKGKPRGWKTGVMAECYVHQVSGHLASAVAQLNSVLIGYELATAHQ
jgi:hypothetical protein